MKELFKENYRLFKASFKQVMLFELFYKAVFLVLFLPLSGFLLDATVKLSGFRYLTNENLYSYLKNPATWLLLLLVVFLNLLYLMGEFCALLILIQGVQTPKPVKLRRKFLLGLLKGLAVVHPRNAGMLLICLLWMPVSNIGVWVWLFTSFQMPDMLARTMHQYPVIPLVLVVVLLVLYVLTIYWLFALPSYTFHAKSFCQAVKESRRLSQGRFGRTLLSWLVWNLHMAVLVFCFYCVVVSLLVLGIGLFGVKQNVQMALFLSIFHVMNLVILTAAGVLSTVMNLVFVLNLYRRYLNEQSGYQTLEVLQLTNSRRKVRRKWRTTFAVLLVVIVSLNCVYAYLLLNDAAVNYLDGLGIPQITSHRGNSTAAPENTMLAVEYAVRDLSDCVEIDVQETLDGQIVVIHDTNLKRTTGLDQNVWETTYAEIQELDAGFWFDPQIQDAKIPTLDEVLDYCDGKINLNIEIKGYEHADNLEQSVIDIIEAHDMESQCYFTSFNYNSLRTIKTINPDFQTGYIVSAAYGDFSRMKYADFFSVRSTSITSNMVKEIHASGKQVHAWTVNGPDEMRNLMELGVDNIITDNPIMARKTLYGERTAPRLTELLEVIFN